MNCRCGSSPHSPLGEYIADGLCPSISLAEGLYRWFAQQTYIAFAAGEIIMSFRAAGEESPILRHKHNPYKKDREHKCSLSCFFI